MNISQDRLFAIAHQFLLAAGSDDYEASVVAQHMVEANLKGHPSHGVSMLAEYVSMLQRGILHPNTPARLVKDSGAILQFSGDGGYGQRVGREAIDAAIERARELGICLMTLQHSRHLGRIGTFGEQVAAAGLISIHFVNVQDNPPLVAPFGGRSARFGTNPICIAIPGPTAAEPIILDFATSAVAFGKIRVAHLAGTTFSEPVIVTDEGVRTADPDAMFDPDHTAAMLPFGLQKGSGLMLAAELLAGILSGGGTLQPEHERLDAITNNMTTIVIDPANAADSSWFTHELTATLEYMKSSTPSDPDEPVLTPGEIERQRKARQQREGVEFSEGEWQSLIEAGATFGMPASAFTAE